MIPQVHGHNRRRVVLRQGDKQSIRQLKRLDRNSHRRKLHRDPDREEPQLRDSVRLFVSTLLVVVATTVAIVVAFVTIVWHSQERIVFQPPAPPHPDVRSVRRLEYTASDGQPLFAYVVGDPSPANGLLI